MTRKRNGAVFTIISLSMLLLPPALWAEKQDNSPQAVDQRLADEKISAGEPFPRPPVDLISPADAAANDDCDSPEDLPVNGTVLGTTIDATTDPAAIAAGFCGTSVSNPSAGIWYRVTGNGNSMTASTCNPGTDYDSKLTVYCGDCAAGLTCVDGNDDQPGGFDPTCDSLGIGQNRGSTVSWETQHGAEYLVFVHGFTTATGAVELTVDDDLVASVNPVSCLPEGACCGGAPCSVITESGCQAAGGNYQGDGTECYTPLGNPASYSATPGIPIPDADPAGITHTIYFPDTFTIGDVNVDLGVTHTWINDLRVTLSHNGTTVSLWDRACGSQNDMAVTFDDEGGPLVCAEPTTGTITPSSADGSPLNAFDGMNASGDWTLTVSDNVGLDIGTLDSWGLEIVQGAAICPIMVPTFGRLSLIVMGLLTGFLGLAVLVRRRRT